VNYPAILPLLVEIERQEKNDLTDAAEGESLPEADKSYGNFSKLTLIATVAEVLSVLTLLVTYRTVMRPNKFVHLRIGLSYG
jgi:hypothetical protein